MVMVVKEPGVELAFAQSSLNRGQIHVSHIVKDAVRSGES
jgi:hypothetical protein